MIVVDPPFITREVWEKVYHLFKHLFIVCIGSKVFDEWRRESIVEHDRWEWRDVERDIGSVEKDV
jgi:hypothetical protein